MTKGVKRPVPVREKLQTAKAVKGAAHLSLFGGEVAPPTKAPLFDRYIFPPLSVLRQADGEWQSRKRHWLSIGLKSEEGREHVSLWGDVATRQASTPKGGWGEAQIAKNVSIFDPVLCELSYAWFSRRDSVILDPFAGGSVRGIVAAHLERSYWGCDLSEVQVLANRKQAEELAHVTRTYMPHWEHGDSLKLVPRKAPRADFVFSCPPYGDLEVYSDDPADISNMPWEECISAYRGIISAAVAKLRPNRFAAFVVGNFREKKTGRMLDLAGETVRAFEDAGAMYYNDIIVTQMIGTAAFRATGQFAGSRKVVKVHQNLLVFCKGEPKLAAAYCKDLPNELSAGKGQKE